MQASQDRGRLLHVKKLNKLFRIDAVIGELRPTCGDNLQQFSRLQFEG